MGAVGAAAELQRDAVNYGFAIDTRACIGCHACSVACKSENQVPLGVHRTWVKTVETGRFPDTRRAFQVTRCNHCKNPPCVRICPVAAMYQRPDGIVAFSGDACIGCKACLQACPYDAIYVDPDTGTAAKCHYCGHRVEQGMEPACVVVCPTHAILAGDLDDPTTEIARTIARHEVTVRKPEQGTQPKLVYLEGNAVAMRPTELPRTPAALAAAEVLDPGGARIAPVYASAGAYAVALRLGDAGPIHVAPGRAAQHVMQQATYTAWHKVPWHWQVPAYLVTKAIGCGLFLVLACRDGREPTTVYSVASTAIAEAVGLAALGATALLLVADLERPERFLRILLRPQWRSWLARGAFLLTGLGAVAAVATAMDAGRAAWGWPTLPGWEAAGHLALVPLSIGGAVYTGFLFGQCEGRDLWQGRLLPLQLLVRAVVAGLAALAILGAFLPGHFDDETPGLLATALGLDLALLLGTELLGRHSTETAARAARAMTRGRYAGTWWIGAVVVGHLAPLAALVAGGWHGSNVPAGVAALVGLYCCEHAFVMAAQEVPNS